MNPSGLLSVGTNIVRQTSASGAPTVDSAPGQSGLGFLKQGFIERSNVQMSRELVDQIPGAEFIEMKGMGHFPMCEDPERFRAILRPVLEKILAS